MLFFLIATSANWFWLTNRGPCAPEHTWRNKAFSGNSLEEDFSKRLDVFPGGTMSPFNCRVGVPDGRRSQTSPGAIGVVRGPAWTWSFWHDSIEWNSIKRLPSIDASLRCVFALQDAINVHVWVGGSYGVILHSPDRGQHWEQLSPVRKLITPAVASGNTLSLDLSL